MRKEEAEQQLPYEEVWGRLRRMTAERNNLESTVAVLKEAHRIWLELVEAELGPLFEPKPPCACGGRELASCKAHAYKAGDGWRVLGAESLNVTFGPWLEAAELGPGMLKPVRVIILPAEEGT